MKTISLFSGCGGMDLGAEKAGAVIVFANDIDSDSCQTLKNYNHTAEVTNCDISKVDGFPSADLVIGGYPCQSFSMGGNRDPHTDHRTYLYQHFARCLEAVQPQYFVAENVSGLQKLRNGKYLHEQVGTFSKCGRHGYTVSCQILDAKDYGVPQTRKRMLIVGVRKDLGLVYDFPKPTHGKSGKRNIGLLPYASHGEAIKHLPLWPKGEFYERPHDPEGHMSWYYMSRNRKAPWDGPSYTVVANFRHVTLHPACPTMKLTWSDLKNGWKQRWDFSSEYEHLINHPERPILKEPRRLSWRECALIQTFPEGFEPAGNVESKFTQIGNAVPPLLAELIIRRIVDGSGLINPQKLYTTKPLF